jgi:hypothetical protein
MPAFTRVNPGECKYIHWHTAGWLDYLYQHCYVKLCLIADCDCMNAASAGRWDLQPPECQLSAPPSDFVYLIFCRGNEE